MTTWGIRVRAVGRWLGRARDLFPATWLGLGLAGGGLWAWRSLGLQELDLVFLVVGYALLGLFPVALVVVLGAALYLRFGKRFQSASPGDIRLETGTSTLTGEGFPAFRGVPLLEVKWGWDRPQGVDIDHERKRGRLLERATASDRGEASDVVRRIVVQDVFGICRIAVRRRAEQSVHVLPRLGALRSTPLLVSLTGGDDSPHPLGLDEGDRVELRRYVPGDSARFIHWKVFGRTRKLMVRVPERALTRARRSVAYLVVGPGDDATAALARVAVETQSFAAEWIFGADGSAEDATTPDAAVPLIVRSSSARERGGQGLSAFLDRAERGGPASVVLFVPPEPGAWLEPVLHAMRRLGPARRVSIVIGVDGLARNEPESRARRWMTLRKPLAGSSASKLEEVLRSLSAWRCPVVVLDRSTGKVLGERHIAASVRPSAETKRTENAA